MPKLKKPPKNPYYFFITSRRDEMEAKGYRIGGFDNAQKTFGHEWSKMSKEDKAPYEQMAKEAKEQEKFNVNNKFTVTGESYAQVHQKVMDHKTAQEQMEEFIRCLASGPEAGDRMFVFMKAVYSVEEIIDKKNKAYWPNELSMATFSLREGLRSIYTTLVDTQVTPVGYRSQAKEACEETLLPMPGDSAYTAECRDYRKILKNIQGFANHWLKDEYYARDHRHVFFALESEREPIRSCIQWMVNKLSGRAKEKYQRFVDNLKIYKISKLILSMAEEAHRVNPAYDNYIVAHKLESAAESVITKGNYDYREEIACAFHKVDASMKMRNCAQSIVMRRIFMLFEEYIPAFKFQWIDRHQIGKLGKGIKGPMIKKKREEEQQEEVLTDEPAWLKSEQPKSSTNVWDHRGDPNDEYDNAWGTRKAPTPSFGEGDFPSLGRGRGSRLSPEIEGAGSSSWARRPPPPSSSSSAGRGRGGVTIGTFDEEDDFPALGSSSKGRGRGRF